jgi:hypothetical protein
MLNDRKIRIQKPIHTILRTALLALIQFAASNRTRDTFLPADVCEVVDRYTIIISKALPSKKEQTTAWSLPEFFHLVHIERGDLGKKGSLD